MSLYFTKLFSTLTDSTIWCEDNPTRIVWIAMLAMADRKGIIHASIPGLANRARVSIEECESALDRFMLPDPYSRTEDHEGRRIERIEGGWRLLNYEKYRELGNDETVKESKRKWAEKNRKKSNKVDSSRHKKTIATQAEAEAEAEAVNTPSEYAPRQIIASRKREVIEKFNKVASTKDWFVLDGRPPKTTSDLLTKFCENETMFGQLDAYMERLMGNTMSACRIDTFLRPSNFKSVMSGEWDPKPKRSGGYQANQPATVEVAHGVAVHATTEAPVMAWHDRDGLI